MNISLRSILPHTDQTYRFAGRNMPLHFLIFRMLSFVTFHSACMSVPYLHAILLISGGQGAHCIASFRSFEMIIYINQVLSRNLTECFYHYDPNGGRRRIRFISVWSHKEAIMSFAAHS